MTIDEALSRQALSIRQLWASMIISGSKTVELRSWQSSYRGWILIHSGKKVDEAALHLLGYEASDYQTGGLLAIAQLRDVRKIETPAQWQALRAGPPLGGPVSGRSVRLALHRHDRVRRMVPAPGEL